MGIIQMNEKMRNLNIIATKLDDLQNKTEVNNPQCASGRLASPATVANPN